MPRPAGVVWDDVPDLETAKTRDLADRYGVTMAAVWCARKVRLIPSPPRSRWDDVIGLGIDSDRVVAEREGVPVGTVACARRARGKAAVRRRFDSERRAALRLRAKGKRWTYAAIASVVGVHPHTVGRWIREEGR